MWQFVVGALFAGFIASYVLMPKPKNRPAESESGIDVPTATTGRPIAILFGVKNIKSPNIVWYGDFDSEPIKRKGGKK